MMESEVLRACCDYLQFGANQGKWFWMRCNSGTLFVPNRGGGNRRVNLCPEGTADLLVIQVQTWWAHPTHVGVRAPRVLWVETKHKGKQSESQKRFQEQVEAQGCDYLICRDVDQLRERLDD